MVICGGIPKLTNSTFVHQDTYSLLIGYYFGLLPHLKDVSYLCQPWIFEEKHSVSGRLFITDKQDIWNLKWSFSLEQNSQPKKKKKKKRHQSSSSIFQKQSGMRGRTEKQNKLPSVSSAKVLLPVRSKINSVILSYFRTSTDLIIIYSIINYIEIWNWGQDSITKTVDGNIVTCERCFKRHGMILTRKLHIFLSTLAGIPASVCEIQLICPWYVLF